MEEERRNSMVMYRGFYESMDSLTDAQFRQIHCLIYERGFNRVPMASDDPVLNIMIQLIQPQLDANYRKAIAGKKGGRPPKKKDDSGENKP